MEHEPVVEHLQSRLAYYKGESGRIAQQVTTRHNARLRRGQGTSGPIPASYWKLSALLATDSHASILRLRLASFLLAGGQVPHGPSLDRVMLEFGSFSWAALAYSLQDRKLAAELYQSEKRSRGPRRAVAGWCKGLAKVVGFSLLSDWACLRCLDVLRHRLQLPGHLPLAVSVWAGNALVRSVSWRMRGRRSFPGIACGEGLTLFLQAETDAVWVSMRDAWWKLPVCLTLHVVVLIAVQVCEVSGSEFWTAHDVLTFCGLAAPETNLLPVCIMPVELEDAIDAGECHDMKCPITFGVMVQPVDFEGKLYERSAAERWIRRHARVPHSPDTPAFKQSLRHCSDMDRLLRQFRAEFGLGIEWEAS